MESKQKQKQKVVITVPHGCPPEREHCDLHATEFALLLAEQLDTCNILDEVTGHINIIPTRDVVDMNRAEARDEPFRKKIDKTLETNEDTKTIVFDVHSSPSGAFREGEPTLFFDIEGLPQDDQLVQDLIKALSQENIVASRVRGTQENDIVVTTLKKDIPAVLIEFNQGDIEGSIKAIAAIGKYICERGI